MRTIPVDNSRLTLLFAGHVAAKPMYEDGKRLEGRQAADDYGTPIWIVDCLLDSDDERAEVLGIAVASAVQPVLKKWNPVEFKNLECGVYRDRLTGQPKTTFRASGIENAA